MSPGFPAAGPGPGLRGSGKAPRGARRRGRILLAGAASLLAWGLLHRVAPPEVLPWSRAMREASTEMARGIGLAARYCLDHGIPVDLSVDPDGTCLVGPPYTPLFTSLGQMEAKRTALNPDMAGLMVHLLARAGVSSGDRVAIGASGSFPGLLLATLAAAKALNAHPVTVLSLGASSYGATRPEFDLLDLYRLMERGGLVADPPAGVSLGGEGDVGAGFPDDLKEELRGSISRAGVPLLEEAELTAAVARRLELYGAPSAFVNIGGAEVMLGSSPLILDVPAGLILPASEGAPRGTGSRNREFPFPLPPDDQRGVLFAMAGRGVPVIHLLHIRGLAARHGLPWDPVPLPEPGSTPLRDGESRPGWRFWLLTLAYVGALSGIAVAGGIRNRGTSAD